MIITPARFEDMVRSCLTSADMTTAEKTERIIALMEETLDSMGYGAGLRALEEHFER